jgi:hypothetical protein
LAVRLATAAQSFANPCVARWRYKRAAPVVPARVAAPVDGVFAAVGLLDVDFLGLLPGPVVAPVEVVFAAVGVVVVPVRRVVPAAGMV